LGLKQSGAYIGSKVPKMKFAHLLMQISNVILNYNASTSFGRMARHDIPIKLSVYAPRAQHLQEEHRN